MNDKDRALCHATAGLLRASGSLALWGLALAFISGLVLALTGRSLPTATWFAYAVVGLLGLPERYLALRIGFSAALLESLAAGRVASMADLRDGLERLDELRVADESTTADDRVAAARRLMQRHGIVVVVQTVVFAMALAMQDWR